MNGNMEKLSEKKLSQYNEVLSLMESDQKNVNYNDSWEYKLPDLANKIINRLKVEIPEITRKNEIVFIKEEKYIRALTLFLAYFQDYLSLEIITSLENAIDAHLVKLYKRFESCNKDIIDITKESVGITIIGYTSDNKHIVGDIDIRLQKRGIKVVYLCNSMRAYENLKERIKDFEALILIAHPIYYAYISRVKVLLSTNTPLPLQKINNLKTKIIHLGHNFNEALQYTLWRTDKNYVFNSLKRERLDRSHYVVAHTENDYRVLQKTCEYFNIANTKILKGGNPSLDWTLHQYQENAQLSNKSRKYLLLAPSYLENFLEDSQMIDALEEIINQKIFLVIRPHPLQLQKVYLKYKDLLDGWSKKNFQFKIDDSGKYFNDYLVNSFALLTDESSMGVSYPFYALKPSVIYIKETRRRGVRIDGIGLYNENLNILVDNCETLKRSIIGLSSGGGIIDRERFIYNFRNEQVYNLEKSSKYLVNVIRDMLQ